MLALLGTIVCSGYLYSAIPKGFFPQEDIGQLVVSTESAPGTSFAAMVDLQSRARDIIRKDPAVDTVASSAGSGGFSPTTNSGRMFVNLVPRDQRPPVDVVARRLRQSVSDIPGLNVFVNPLQNLNLSGRSSKSLYRRACTNTPCKRCRSTTSTNGSPRSRRRSRTCRSSAT
jgi:HAE1 family hydrophobic/amphiphilic exporter-1